MEGRVAHHIVKAYFRLVAADVPALNGGIRIKEPCHPDSLCIQLTAIEVHFHRHEVEEIPLAAGQVRDQVMAGWFQARGDKFAETGRRKKLAVLKFLLCIAELVVILIVAPLQPVESAVARIGIIDVLMGNAIGFRCTVCYQAEDFFI